MLGLGLFAPPITKSVSDEEFRTTHEQALASTISYLKDGWIAALRSAVRLSLKEVGKGWYNLLETSTEVSWSWPIKPNEPPGPK